MVVFVDFHKNFRNWERHVDLQEVIDTCFGCLPPQKMMIRENKCTKSQERLRDRSVVIAKVK